VNLLERIVQSGCQGIENLGQAIHLVTIDGRVHSEALRFEGFADEPRHLPIILNHEDSHSLPSRHHLQSGESNHPQRPEKTIGDCPKAI
jgi:hypothetical protein